MFLLSANSFNQMVRRMRYLREYSGFQQKQGEELMTKQEELNVKRAELANTRKAKQALGRAEYRKGVTHSELDNLNRKIAIIDWIIDCVQKHGYEFETN